MLRMRFGKRRNKTRREQAHVAGQNDKIDPMLTQAGDHIGIVIGAGAAFGDKRLRVADPVARRPRFPWRQPHSRSQQRSQRPAVCRCESIQRWRGSSTRDPRPGFLAGWGLYGQARDLRLLTGLIPRRPSSRVLHLTLTFDHAADDIKLLFGAVEHGLGSRKLRRGNRRDEAYRPC